MLSAATLRVAARAGARRAFHGSARRLAAAEEAAAGATQVILNLSSPTKAMFNGVGVDLVNIPGMTGEYGVAADHAPTISELKPGVVQVYKTEGAEPETFFVPGGIAATHPDSRTDIAAADIATLDEFDQSTAQQLYNESKRKLETLTEGTEEHAVAQIETDVYEAICTALGVSL